MCINSPFHGNTPKTRRKLPVFGSAPLVGAKAKDEINIMQKKSPNERLNSMKAANNVYKNEQGNRLVLGLKARKPIEKNKESPSSIVSIIYAFFC